MTVIVDSAAVPTPRLRPISRRHLDDALTGELGIRPSTDPGDGYHLEEAARALQLDLLHARGLRWPAVAESASRHLRFLESAYDESTKKFRTVRSGDGSWTDAPASPDAHARVLLALAETISAGAGAPDAPPAIGPEPEFVERATVLYDKALPAGARLLAPRAQAVVVLACAAAPPSADGTAVMRNLATGLHARFRSFARPGWPWPEHELSSESGLMPRAMIVAGHRLGAATMLAVGLQVVDWLIDVQTSPEGRCSPVGTEGWTHAGTKAQFDQRPIDVTALLLACEAAYAATGRGRYAATMERAHAWYLGENDLGLRIADPARGSCHDALTADGLAPGEGTEATLMWLTATEHIRAFRAAQVARAGAEASAAPPAPTSIPRSSKRGPVAVSAR